MTSQRHTAPMLDRRRFIFRATLAAAAVRSAPVGALGRDGELRFGLTAVVVRENLNSFNLFEKYLTLRLGRPVEFVQRRTYADIMDLLGRGELDAAWICGYPYVKRRSPEFLDLLVAPVYAGAPLYRSLVIVPQDSPAEHFEDLAGKSFAYSDPDSNSGYMVPRATLRDAGFDPDRFFRFTFFTFSHAETVMAVSERMADGGAVDSYVYEVMQKFHSPVAGRTRVIHRSKQFGFPPIVVRRDLRPEVRERLRDVLVDMSSDADGVQMLARLSLDGFAEVSPALYDPIREVVRKATGNPRTAEAPGG
ncbi:MAG: phosphate/phosphite/phosphonate ABC transporter substrate-binding protein [Paracoccaceae bacterium]